jgi:hypothetical protein
MNIKQTPRQRCCEPGTCTMCAHSHRPLSGDVLVTSSESALMAADSFLSAQDALNLTSQREWPPNVLRQRKNAVVPHGYWESGNPSARSRGALVNTYTEYLLHGPLMAVSKISAALTQRKATELHDSVVKVPARQDRSLFPVLYATSMPPRRLLARHGQYGDGNVCCIRQDAPLTKAFVLVSLDQCETWIAAGIAFGIFEWPKYESGHGCTPPEATSAGDMPVCCVGIEKGKVVSVSQSTVTDCPEVSTWKAFPWTRMPRCLPDDPQLKLPSGLQAGTAETWRQGETNGAPPFAVHHWVLHSSQRVGRALSLSKMNQGPVARVLQG